MLWSSRSGRRRGGRQPRCDRYVIGTPDEVAQQLAQAFAWGVTHLVCSLGGRPFTLWSEAMLELFASDVLPRLRQA